jgi:hypothetical protein
MTPPDWASRLAHLIERELAERPAVVHVHRVRATSREEVEVVYSDWTNTELRGFRISAPLVQSAPWRIRESSVGELAFDIRTTVIDEPRAPDDFLSPDTDGVRWLPWSRWLEEVS